MDIIDLPRKNEIILFIPRKVHDKFPEIFGYTKDEIMYVKSCLTFKHIAKLFFSSAAPYARKIFTLAEQFLLLDHIRDCKYCKELFGLFLYEVYQNLPKEKLEKRKINRMSLADQNFLMEFYGSIYFSILRKLEKQMRV